MASKSIAATLFETGHQGEGNSLENETRRGGLAADTLVKCHRPSGEKADREAGRHPVGVGQECLRRVARAYFGRVTAPSDADDTSAQYFANTPLV